jgi:hypothetical protein
MKKKKKKKKKVIYDEESIEFTESTECIGPSLADVQVEGVFCAWGCVLQVEGVFCAWGCVLRLRVFHAWGCVPLECGFRWWKLLLVVDSGISIGYSKRRVINQE